MMTSSSPERKLHRKCEWTYIGIYRNRTQSDGVRTPTSESTRLQNRTTVKQTWPDADGDRTLKRAINRYLFSSLSSVGDLDLYRVASYRETLIAQFMQKSRSSWTIRGNRCMKSLWRSESPSANEMMYQESKRHIQGKVPRRSKFVSSKTADSRPRTPPKGAVSRSLTIRHFNSVCTSAEFSLRGAAAERCTVGVRTFLNVRSKYVDKSKWFLPASAR